MSNINKMHINNVDYDIEDATARAGLEATNKNVETVQQGVEDNATSIAEVQEQANNLKQSLINIPVGAIGCVTPMHYGAFGDGVHDDTEAFKAAIASGHPILLPVGNYLLTETINLPSGCKIEGSKGSVILPTADVAFHLEDKITLDGFQIFVEREATNVHTIFEVDDASVVGQALMRIRIQNIEVFSRATNIPDLYTVFHFHAASAGMYDIVVRDCVFSNSSVDGYVARVYTKGTGWLTTVTFENNNSTAFRWHYFFAENDQTLVNDRPRTRHIVQGCVAQCSAKTNGFLFITSNAAVIHKSNMAWDWDRSVNCANAPYVISANMDWHAFSMEYIFNDIRYPYAIKVYDGDTFTGLKAGQMDIPIKMGGSLHHNNIPKYVALGASPCVRLGKVSGDINYSKLRFYLADNCGITYVSVVPKNKTVTVSQPLYWGYRIGVDENYNVYLYTHNGTDIQYNTALMTLPRHHDYPVFATAGATATTNEKTIDCWENLDTCLLASKPDGVVEYTIKVQPNYVVDDNGNKYKITAVTGDDGTVSLGLSEVYGPDVENVTS